MESSGSTSVLPVDLVRLVLKVCGLALCSVLLAACDEAARVAGVSSSFGGGIVTSMSLSDYGLSCKSERSIHDDLLETWESRVDYCVRNSGPVLSFVSGVHEGRFGPVPAQIVEPKGGDVRGVIIFLVGGPGGQMLTDIKNSPQDLFARHLAEAGYAVVYLGYYGTAYISTYPESDLLPAAKQVRAYTEFLQATQAALPVTVMGYSAGAHVAYLATLDHPDVKALLVAPPLGPPHLLLRRQLTAPIKPADYLDTRIIKQRRVDQNTGREIITKVPASMQELFSTFFGDAYDLDLADLITKYPSSSKDRLTIVLGTSDETIGLDYLPKLRRRHPSIEVRQVRGLVHQFRTKSAAEDLGDLVLDEIQTAR